MDRQLNILKHLVATLKFWNMCEIIVPEILIFRWVDLKGGFERLPTSYIQEWWQNYFGGLL